MKSSIYRYEAGCAKGQLILSRPKAGNFEEPVLVDRGAASFAWRRGFQLQHGAGDRPVLRIVDAAAKHGEIALRQNWRTQKHE
jgi:hypothetical protein